MELDDIVYHKKSGQEDATLKGGIFLPMLIVILLPPYSTRQFIQPTEDGWDHFR